LLCILPILLAGYLLYVLQRTAPDDRVLTEILMQEIVAEEPGLLLPAPLPALEQQPVALLGPAMGADPQSEDQAR
jgi:hypothetical protein